MTSAPALSESSFVLCIVSLRLFPLRRWDWRSSTPAWAARAVPRTPCSHRCACSQSPPSPISFSDSHGKAPRVDRRTLSVIRGTAWNWIAAQPLFFRGLTYSDSASLIACLQMLSVGLAAIIPLGSGSDRWRLGAICASTALFAGITYPLFAHWVWGGGWLSQIGRLGIGQGFLDCAGSGTIQVTGGFTALSIAWIIGPRRGKFSHDGMPAAIPGHNSVLVLVGCLIALVGWLALNSAGSLLFAGASSGRLVLVVINTLLAAFSGLLGALITTRIRFGKPDTSLSANGWIAGLVAISASCAFVVPATAIVIGAIAGILVPFAIDTFEFRLASTIPADQSRFTLSADCGD